MAYPTAVNDQITDAITQVNLMSIGVAPGQAMGLLYQATAQALANAAQNATTAQAQSNILYDAATSAGSAIILSLAPKKQP